ncbi:MAG: 2-dehydro-3-deoxyphosphooctonate aldolase (KDO 8-P synthase) [Bacteroidia bacterium]|jgi:2-dehydro-3-deoxyphosphooctonate aldolase (KDO 8-P synthase)|tara:strand:- start:279 stop:1127 length:849 start_codon:yes stop_codon:yes gene_type:complete
MAIFATHFIVYILNNIESTLHQVLTSDKLFLLGGPCAIESEKITLETAEFLTKLTDRLGIPYVYKSSYRKANRTKASSFTGIGDEKALKLLGKVRSEFGVPTVTDIHESHEAEMAAEYVDVLQIPAFLFRQTELLQAAAKTGKVINIKKGQFAAAEAMKFAATKVEEAGNSQIMLTERGNMFGYGDMIIDYRNIIWMKEMGYPVIMDVTHSLQQPNNGSGVTGGLPMLIEPMAKAAVAVGVDGLFIETHPDPSTALSDGANMLPLHKMEELLTKLLRLRESL